MRMKFEGYNEGIPSADIPSINSFVTKMDECIDTLVNIKGKVDYAEGYESGYNDCANAIRNTMHSLAKKFNK